MRITNPNFIFPFDKSIGHHRRYSRKDIKRLTVSGLEIERVFFLDSLGMLLSMINRLFLRAVIPTASQIRFWDQNVIPLSRYLDRAFGAVAGRSIVMVWRKE